MTLNKRAWEPRSVCWIAKSYDPAQSRVRSLNYTNSEATTLFPLEFLCQCDQVAIGLIANRNPKQQQTWRLFLLDGPYSAERLLFQHLQILILPKVAIVCNIIFECFILLIPFLFYDLRF